MMVGTWGAGGRLLRFGSPKITKNAWIPLRWFLADRKYVRRDIRGLGALARDSLPRCLVLKIAELDDCVGHALRSRTSPAFCRHSRMVHLKARPSSGRL